jgi:predicted TIM-barrel fold metal-dependent hydrolase
MPTEYRVVDYHTHLFPQYVDTILKVMDKNHIFRAVNLGMQPEMSKTQESGTIEYSLEEALRSFPADRFAVFFSPDFSQIDAAGFAPKVAEDLERAVEMGARGLKIFKSLGLTARDSFGKRVSILDSRLDLLWKKAAELGIPVSIHIADPKALFSPPEENNPEYQVLRLFPEWSFYGGDYPTWDELLDDQRELVSRHPRTKYVCVHFGNASEDLRYVARLLDDNPNVCIDTAARVAFLGAHAAPQVREFFIKYQDRILFGTDFGVGPVSKAGIFWLGVGDGKEKTLADCDRYFDAQWRYFETDQKNMRRPEPISGVERLDALHLPAAVLEKLYHANAEKLIPGW